VAAERKSDITLPKSEELSCNAALPCATLTEGDRVSDERHSVSVMALTNNKVLEGPTDHPDFDYLDGPTIVAEVCESLQFHKPISHKYIAAFWTT
jgi:hypothetical protein